jgi:hypothetical protein
MFFEKLVNDGLFRHTYVRKTKSSTGMMTSHKRKSNKLHMYIFLGERESAGGSDLTMHYSLGGRTNACAMIPVGGKTTF